MCLRKSVEARALPDFKYRERHQTTTVTWYKIAGDKIVDRRPWPGKYIPIVRIVGEETVIDGKLDRKGHVRNLKDPQRMYNYWSSARPWNRSRCSPRCPTWPRSRPLTGLEDYWKNANRENRAVLPYNSVDEEGNQIPAPAAPVQPPTPWRKPTSPACRSRSRR
jgi:hypothetical protein